MIIDAMQVPIRHDENDNWTKLRDYQHHVVTGARLAYARKHNAVLLVMPTGGGKTRTSCYIIDQAIARGRKVLILVHRQELAKQFSEALTDYGVRHGFIGPGAPFEVGKNVQVASVQTLVKRMDKLPWRPDLIVIDEAHHCTEGSSWGKVIDRYMHAVILGLSATPERLDGKGLGRGHGGYFDAMVIGPTPAFLIDRGNLSPYRIYGTDATPDMTGVKRTGGDFNRGEAEARVDRPFITGSAVAHYCKLASGKRAVVFCVSRRHAEHVAAEFCQAGLKFVVVDGTLSDDERERRVKQLEMHEIDGIVSVDLISEGFDLPSIECAISLRPTQSTSLWVQQIGRVLRPSPGKDYAIILDHVGNTHRHGLPDDLREWSLEGRPKKAGKAKEKAEDPVKQCERCFTVHRPAPRCPMCGYEYEVKGRDISEVEGELKEIETAKKRLERRQLLSKCRTYDDFLQVASQLGYKPGWARIQFDLRQKRRPGSAGQVAQQHSLP